MTKKNIDDKTRPRFTRPLLQWYRSAGRDLPWRLTCDPYAIWVSEIMLQQTQVATVLPYYHRFLKIFPTIQALALSDLERVLKLWQGLGYYARARHLHKAAGEVLVRFSGKVPSTYQELNALPGIGRSTAGAILTIAHKKRYPILDGNVRRVLCRFFGITKDPREKWVKDWLWHTSETLLPHRDAATYLQAIMDFGATVCTPKQPSCTPCPVARSCEAFKKDLQHILPVKTPRKKVPHFDYFAAVIKCDDTVLIQRRPLKGLLAGLWEFPGERVETALSSVAASCEQFLRRQIDTDVPNPRHYMTIRHAFTHFKMTLHVFSFHLKKPVSVKPPLKWVSKTSLSGYAFSSAHQKIISGLPQGEEQSILF